MDNYRAFLAILISFGGFGVWAATAQRTTALVIMLGLATARGVPRLPPRPLIGPMLVSGTCGSLAIVAFTLGAIVTPTLRGQRMLDTMVMPA